MHEAGSVLFTPAARSLVTLALQPSARHRVWVLTTVSSHRALTHAAHVCAAHFLALKEKQHREGKSATRLLAHWPDGCVSIVSCARSLTQSTMFTWFLPCASHFPILAPALWECSVQESERFFLQKGDRKKEITTTKVLVTSKGCGSLSF